LARRVAARPKAAAKDVFDVPKDPVEDLLRRFGCATQQVESVPVSILFHREIPEIQKT
jgi:hypothetical protein